MKNLKVGCWSGLIGLVVLVGFFGCSRHAENTTSSVPADTSSNFSPNPNPNPDTGLGLGGALASYNQWKAARPNAIFKFQMTKNGLRTLVTSYYVGEKFKVVSQVLDGIGDEYVEFLSKEGDVLVYLPSTRVTFKEPLEYRAHVFKELGWNHDLTLAKVQSFGGTLEYHHGDNDSIVIKSPGDITLEFQIDREGKLLRQVAAGPGFPPMASDIEYVTFDADKVKAEYDKVLVKEVVDAGVNPQDAFAAEMRKNADKTKAAKDYIKSVTPQ